MEKFYFQGPSVELKEKIIDFLDEFVKYGSDIHGSGSLDRIFRGFTFEQALERCLKMEDPEYAASIAHCPGKTFLLTRENDGRIVATLNLRWDLNEAMLRFAGHIGYAVRPTERRKGYAKINLYAGLREAEKLGLDKVMIGCNAENTGSNRTVTALGGVLERSGTDPEDGMLTNVYWMNVRESLDKYVNEYGRFIANGPEIRSSL